MVPQEELTVTKQNTNEDTEIEKPEYNDFDDEDYEEEDDGDGDW